MRVVYFNIEKGDWLSEYDTIQLLAHIGMGTNILLIIIFFPKKIPPLRCSPMYWKCEPKMTFPLPRKLPLRFLLLNDPIGPSTPH